MKKFEEPDSREPDKIEEPDLSGTYSYADYMKWTWDEMVELIHGKIYKMSAPGSRHQIVVGNLHGLVWNFLRGKKCKVFIAPFDVRLPSSSIKKADVEIATVVQPDLCVVCDLEKIDKRGCLGAPDWVVEVLSQFTSRKDLNEKFSVYEECGVKEYWLIHPQEQTVLIYTANSDGKYQGILKPFTLEDKLSPTTLPGLVIDLSEVFPQEEY